MDKDDSGGNDADDERPMKKVSLRHIVIARHVVVTDTVGPLRS